MHSSPPSDLQQTDSYFVVAHFHYVMFGGSMMGLFAGIYYYFPKITGRIMNEKLGHWHFWLTFIGMNLTFFPMHFAGLNGMPRRIWSYDANQGWDIENHIATIGAYVLLVATAIFVYNLVRSRKFGVVAGNDPWGAPTIEWSIPSPPPDYNYARIPTVTSRYPMWDVKSPRLTAFVPHGKEAETQVTVAVGGKAAGSISTPSDTQLNAENAHPSAAELGIHMPTPTIKPLIATIWLTLSFVGLMWNKHVGIMVASGILFAITLVAWLTTPLEPEH
jgi:cytochrome c oxidase subunit 1